MGRFISDQNKLVGIHESGTYGTSGGQIPEFWIGMIQSHSVTEDEGLIEQRYFGTASRNFDTFIQGPVDITGTLEYNPQDMRIVFWNLGSTYSISGTSTAINTSTEIDSDVIQSPFTSGTANNAPISFQIEDSKQSPGAGRNFNRIIRGVVPNVTTLDLSMNEKALVTVDYLAQSAITGSGATTTFTEMTRRPYLWSDAVLNIGIGANLGSAIDTARNISWSIDNGREIPHYVTGSRVGKIPFNKNRIHTVELTMDWDGLQADMLYNNFYKGGSKFNMTLDLNADDTAGSQHVTYIMSGCFITSSDVPSPLEGVHETTLTIRPETVSATEYNFFTSGMQFNPWT